jgi:hypothetical protein
MRYHWGLGVGHLHAHGLTSTPPWNPDQPRDANAPDGSSANPEDPIGDVESNAPGFDDNACDESVNLEMTLDERDVEGWEDVESDTSETGCGNGDDESEDDFEEMYE